MFHNIGVSGLLILIIGTFILIVVLAMIVFGIVNRKK